MNTGIETKPKKKGPEDTESQLAAVWRAEGVVGYDVFFISSGHT